MKLPTHRPAWLSLERLAKLPGKIAGRIPRFPDDIQLPLPERVRKAMPVFVERSILALPKVYVNGGSRGFLVGIAPFLFALYFFFQNVNRLLPPGL